MISNINRLITVREFDLQKNHTAKRILLFVKNTLPKFEFIYKQNNSVLYIEDDISKELSRYFNDEARADNLFFQFNEKKGVDFTIHVTPYIMGAKSIFMIEAKRLSKSHYDYVYGRTGGIERIKREQEGFNEDVEISAMIGYIQDEDKDYWKVKINNWIQDLIERKTDIDWFDEDKISTDFTSLHSRITKEKISLYHFWIHLN